MKPRVEARPPAEVVTLPSGRVAYLGVGIYDEPYLLSVKASPPADWKASWSEADRNALRDEMGRRWNEWASRGDA